MKAVQHKRWVGLATQLSEPKQSMGPEASYSSLDGVTEPLDGINTESGLGNRKPTVTLSSAVSKQRWLKRKEASILAGRDTATLQDGLFPSAVSGGRRSFNTELFHHRLYITNNGKKGLDCCVSRDMIYRSSFHFKPSHLSSVVVVLTHHSPR